MSNRRTAHRVSRVSAVALASAFLVSTASVDAFAQAAPPTAEAKPKPAEAKPPAAETKPADAKPAPAPAVKPETKPTTAPTAAPTTPPPAAPAPTAPAAKRAAPADVEAAPPLAEEPPPAAPPAAPPPAETRVAPTNATALWPQPSEDAAALAAAPNDAKVKQPAIDPSDAVYAADWWSHARPVVELHGYFRFRAQLMHRFALGRVDPVAEALWARPADDQYPLLQGGGPFGPALCTDSEADEGDSDDPSTASNACKQGTQAGANIRFRLAPELHISDNLRVLSQIDLLDNLVLGSTPGGNRYSPSAGGYTVSARDGYTPLAFDDDTQDPPASGVNSFSDSIRVKRAWAEYATPMGELRFGRMPAHFGLGIFWNAGDGHDDDYQSTVDRLQLITGIKPLDIYFSGAWDFPNEGATSDTVALPNPEPYDLAQLDDVDQYMLSAVRKKSPELERLSLSRGELVLNGGVQLVYRAQRLANDRTQSDGTGTCSAGAWALGCRPSGTDGKDTYVRRGAEAWIPDVWLELLYKKFRFAAEAVTIQGSIESIETASNPQFDSDDPGYDIESYAVATELEQLLVEDKLKLGFKFGWASGDADVPSLTPGLNGTQRQLGDRTFETFRFHPSYRVDMILHRNLLTRVQGTYYFRPNVDYDFLRDPNGQRLGGGIAAIWSRASEFMQAPGHARDLGIELNGRLYYQAKDGALNDIAGSLGGFYTELNYGVLFPMAGLGYTDRVAAAQNPPETRIAQTLRWYLGVMF
jgi:uncharacterized protein (TIGR04551 family)